MRSSAMVEVYKILYGGSSGGIVMPGSKESGSSVLLNVDSMGGSCNFAASTWVIVAPTGKLRWLIHKNTHEGILQQEWMDRSTGEVEWRNIPEVEEV